MLIRLLYVFFIGSMFGWCLETVFRRFNGSNTSRKWINPGFLIGPYLPIYGFGMCTLYLLSEINQVIYIESPIVSKIIILLLMAICMTVLELIAGIIFIQGMQVKLWDYSSRPLNYKGIICLEFSFYWLVLAAVYYLGVHPFMVELTDRLVDNQGYLFPLGVIFGVFAVDFGYSIQIAAKIKKFAKENNILIRYEELKSNIRKYAEEHKERYWFMFAFHSKSSLNEHLVRYSDMHEKLVKFKEKIHQNKSRR